MCLGAGWGCVPRVLFPAGQELTIWVPVHVLWCEFVAGWRAPDTSRSGMERGVLRLTRAQKDEYRQMTGIYFPTVEELAASPGMSQHLAERIKSSI